ncbi:MAG: tetratricopeptide repeat protein [Chloroflexota bacterium]
MAERGLINADRGLVETDPISIPIAALLVGDGRNVAKVVANHKALLEARLAADPEDYRALVDLGELLLRVGLAEQAQHLLYQATLRQPPSWEEYQRTSYLLRRAEEQRQRAFDRLAGVAPPAMVRRLAGTVVSRFSAFIKRPKAGRGRGESA